jgi:hypothetical protein
MGFSCLPSLFAVLAVVLLGLGLVFGVALLGLTAAQLMLSMFS